MSQYIRNIPYWADHKKEQAYTINHNDGGRGLYFYDPNEPVFNELKLSLEDEASVLSAMVQEPILMQRHIVTYAGKAVIARPPERVLELIDDSKKFISQPAV